MPAMPKYRNLDLEAFNYQASDGAERFRVRVAHSPAGAQRLADAEEVILSSDLRQQLRRLEERLLSLPEMIALGEKIAAVLFPTRALATHTQPGAPGVRRKAANPAQAGYLCSGRSALGVRLYIAAEHTLRSESPGWISDPGSTDIPGTQRSDGGCPGHSGAWATSGWCSSLPTLMSLVVPG